MDSTTAKLQKPWIALVLSLTSPGLGHIYNGNLKQGLLIYAVLLGCAYAAYIIWAYLIPNLFLFLLLLIVAFIATIKIAFHAAEQTRHIPSDIPRPWYSRLMGLIVIFLFCGFILSPAISTVGKSFIKAYTLPANSMAPTLLKGDYLLVKQASYGIKFPFTDFQLVTFRSPQRGDMIVFKYPKDESKDFIKRVIGLPGDRVEVREQQVYINDQLLAESYAEHDISIRGQRLSPRDLFGPVTVPLDAYFVLGDNRDHSLDSRFWGFVNVQKIKGKVSFIYWSWDSEKAQIRWDRIGMQF